MARVHKRKPKASAASGKRARIQYEHAKSYNQKYKFPVTTYTDPSIIKPKEDDG